MGIFIEDFWLYWIFKIDLITKLYKLQYQNNSYNTYFYWATILFDN